MPPLVTELLRLCIVVFGAGVGYEVAQALPAEPGSVFTVGPLDSTTLGVLLGAALGYVLGGALGRYTLRSLTAAEKSLESRSTEQVLGGLFGAILGVVIAVGIAWPLLLLGRTLVVLPIFGFVVITVGTLGYRFGTARRDSLLSLLSARTGLSRPVAVGSLDRVLDSSVAIDGRVIDVVRAGFLHGRMLVPQPVLDEIQGLADAGDDLRRARGRRGLDTLEALRRERGVEVEVISDEALEVPDVDAKLVRICLDRNAALLTLDTPLAKVASLAGCRVMNLHALALSLRPPVTAGDSVRVLLLRAGKEPGQAVGYLDDGTMVVAERTRHLLHSEVEVVVSSVLTTANGRMVFARPAAAVQGQGQVRGQGQAPGHGQGQATSQRSGAAPRPSPVPGPPARPGPGAHG